jgi:hypothetical protein
VKPPRKAELLELQKKFRTDRRIAEVLGGVPVYLVAYWRRKKGIPKYQPAKYSERTIVDLWERFQDDEQCGQELGISRSAFYRWRRKYGIRKRLPNRMHEQLEMPLE